MQAASNAYKKAMKKRFRNRSQMRVTLGLINQYAQSSAVVSDETACTYFSDIKKPLDNYEVEELYAICDQNYSAVDGSMYFLPRRSDAGIINQGIVSERLLGAIMICFPEPFDIKGMTIEFGKTYPVSFSIESDNHTVYFSENQAGHFVTEEIFPDATFIRVVPESMVNGQGRLHIHQIIMGIGIYFDNRKILSATKKEHISPIAEELPAIDFSLKVSNKDRTFDIENDSSTLNFLEIGQEIEALYGLELDSGEIEWISGTTVYLRTWSADDEKMTFSASDRFEDLDGMYYKGTYKAEGISLYALAVDVMEDAGIDSRTYWFDSYLENVIVHNPMPVVTHKEALQLIANAGRCLLNQDRNGKIIMKSAFLPDVAAVSDNEAYFSNVAAVLDETEKISYALVSEDYTVTNATPFFLPKQGMDEILNTGYISEAAADENGFFEENPIVELMLEAAYKCFGLTLKFGRNHPEEMIFRTFLNGEVQEEYTAKINSESMLVMHEFPEFDHLVLEFTKGAPNNRVVLNNILFGDSTDYELSYGRELTKTPQGIQLEKVRELQMIRTLYNSSEELKELVRENVYVTEASNRCTFYFTNPSYDFFCEISEAQAGQQIQIVDSSSYYVTVELTGITDGCEVVVSGYEYAVTEAKSYRKLNTVGKVEKWSNPLVSTEKHSLDLLEWIGDYMRADREYSISYRGEPRIDANDIMFLENKYVPDMLVRVYEHTLKFTGALSGTIKARRDMSNVAATKN